MMHIQRSVKGMAWQNGKEKLSMTGLCTSTCRILQICTRVQNVSEKPSRSYTKTALVRATRRVLGSFFNKADNEDLLTAETDRSLKRERGLHQYLLV